MKNLTIVPVDHYQSGLHDKLFKLYESVKPDAICIEYFSPKKILNDYTEMIEYKDDCLIMGKSFQLGAGHEVFSAMHYREQKDNSVMIYSIDDFHKLGKTTIPIVRFAPKFLSRMIVNLVTRLRDWSMKCNTEKILSNHDNIVIVVGKVHGQPLKDKLGNYERDINLSSFL